MPTQAGFISADYKVPGGKLLRARLRIEDQHIESILLTGDFFIHPEHAIKDLEARLLHVAFEEHALRQQIAAFFDSDVQVIGAEVEDFVTVILRAS